MAVALGAFTAVDVDTGYCARSSARSRTMGVGMGLAMAPATEAIMGSLPKAKAGIGSAMNDVVREVGGTLGVAVLGSILSTSYASGMDDATAGLPARGRRGRERQRRRAPTRSPPQIGGGAGAKLIVARRPGVRRRDDHRGERGRAVALTGALVALAFLPSRAREEVPAAAEAAPVVG